MGASSIQEGIIDYYLFQKKISNYLDKTNNEKEEFCFKDAYLVHYEWMEEFKKNIKYKEIENCLDKMDLNENNLKNKKDQIIEYLNKNISIEIEIIPSRDAKTYFLSVSQKKVFNKNILANLIPSETFKAWKLEGKIEKIKIQYLFKKIMMIFVIEQLKKIKLIVTDTSPFIANEKIINLTWFFPDSEAFQEKLKFLQNENSEDILQFLVRKEIFGKPEKTTRNQEKKDEILYILYNEDLYENIRNPKEINFELAKKISFKAINNLGDKYNINSCLQCLANIKPITDYLLNEKKYTELFDNKSLCPLTLQYCQILIGLFCDDSNKNSYYAKSFKNTLDEMFPVSEVMKVNDTKDLILFLFLLERMNSELTNLHNKNCNIKKNENENLNNMNIFDEKAVLSEFLKTYKYAYSSVISENLIGFQKYIYMCQNCQSKAFKFNKLNMLIFNLEEIANFYNLNNECLIPPKITFTQCFSYLTRESIKKDINCKACNAEGNLLYKEILYVLPNYLIINLNRGQGKKFNFDIEIPEIFDSSNFEEKLKNRKFELIGIISHFGQNEKGDCSITFCKHSLDNKWRCYNNNIVAECQNDYLTKGTPYILFYKNMNIDNTNNTNYNNQQKYEGNFNNQNINNNINDMNNNNYNINNNGILNMDFNYNNYFNDYMNMLNLYNINNSNPK